MDVHDTLRDLLGRLREPFTAETLFDRLPDIVYFIKNGFGQYIVVNQTLVDRCGLRRKSDLLGKTAGQVLPAPLGARFEAQDLKVLRTGQALVAQLELHVYASRDVGWCLTSKLPLVATDASVVGLVGVSQDLRIPDARADEYQHVLAGIDWAEDRLATPPTVTQIARVAGMSRFQLDRRMRAVFGLNTGQWLLQRRLDRAQRLLSTTGDSVTSVAQRCGYSDQSAFTRQFRQATGLTPTEFRKARLFATTSSRGPTQ